jgi:hypothetical protein
VWWFRENEAASARFYLHENKKRKSMRVTPSKYNKVIFSFMLLCDVRDVYFFVDSTLIS